MNSLQMNDILQLVEDLIVAERDLVTTASWNYDMWKENKEKTRRAQVQLKNYLGDLIQ